MSNEELKPCRNAASGEHKWRENIGKNANKPPCCVLCSMLKSDLSRPLKVAQEDG
jgi:hypothetical protein